MSEKKNVPKLRFPEFTEPWEQRKVSEMFRVTRGYVLAATQTETERTDEKPYPVYSSQTKDKGLMGYYKDYLYEDAITWTTDGANAGTVNYRAGKFYCTNVCGVLLSNEVKANQMIAEALNNVAKGYVSYVGNPKLMNNVMADIVIQIPTQAEEREQLSSFFANLDHLITLHQRKLDHVKDLKKSMLQKMFPKNGQLYPEVRFPEFTDAWEQRKLGDCVEFLDTMRKPLKEGDREKGQYPYYGASGIVDYVSDYIFDEELVLLSEDGANITDRNYPVCFLASGKCWVNNHAHVLKTNKENENNFICNSLERMDFTPYNSGMAMPKLNKEVCQKIPLSCPSFAEQKEIGDYFRRLDRLITLHQRELDHLKLLKKGMLQQMFV